MAPHNNDIPPLFTVDNYAYDTDGTLYLKGSILTGQLKGKSFIASYTEITHDRYINTDNSEAEICFKSSNKKYYCIDVSVGPDYFCSYDHLTFQRTKNMPNGAFRYAKFMDHVSYIILSGMLVTGI